MSTPADAFAEEIRPDLINLMSKGIPEIIDKILDVVKPSFIAGQVQDRTACIAAVKALTKLSHLDGQTLDVVVAVLEGREKP